MHVIAEKFGFQDFIELGAKKKIRKFFLTVENFLK